MHWKCPCAPSLLFTALWLFLGCGTPGSPLPPSLEIPARVEDLSFQRVGNTVILSWTKPRQTTDLTQIRTAVTSKICRAIETTDLRQCQPIRQMESPAPAKGSLAGSERLEYRDGLTPPLQRTATFALYAVEALNPRGQSAGPSNMVRVPLAPAPAVPQGFLPTLVPSGIRLSFSEPSGPGTPAASVVISRQSKEDPKDAASLTVPVPSSHLSMVDQRIDWEKHYLYSAHAVATVDGIQIISEETPQVEVFAHDVFPPSVPTGVQAVFSGNPQQLFIDLSWNPNSEPDLAGYNVFRSDTSGARKKLNSEIVQTPSFRDSSVAAGETYSYSVSAVDVRGNESAPSAAATETVAK